MNLNKIDVLFNEHSKSIVMKINNAIVSYKETIDTNTTENEIINKLNEIVNEKIAEYKNGMNKYSNEINEIIKVNLTNKMSSIEEDFTKIDLGLDVKYNVYTKKYATNRTSNPEANVHLKSGILKIIKQQVILASNKYIKESFKKKYKELLQVKKKLKKIMRIDLVNYINVLKVNNINNIKKEQINRVNTSESIKDVNPLIDDYHIDLDVLEEFESTSTQNSNPTNVDIEKHNMKVNNTSMQNLNLIMDEINEKKKLESEVNLIKQKRIIIEQEVAQKEAVNIEEKEKEKEKEVTNGFINLLKTFLMTVIETLTIIFIVMLCIYIYLHFINK